MKIKKIKIEYRKIYKCFDNEGYNITDLYAYYFEINKYIFNKIKKRTEIVAIVKDPNSISLIVYYKKLKKKNKNEMY